MRLWSMHPKYLDRQGLVALWREGLLAKKVLEGKTKGYKNHPQLNRFKAESTPLHFINHYLHKVCDEAESRGYNFDRNKLLKVSVRRKIPVTSGQMKYEWQHLLKKQLIRSKDKFVTNKKIKLVELHPMFKVIPGKIADWEIL